MCREESVAPLAPIALFVYNRPEHTRRTVEALRGNDLASQSDLFIFADAAKDESAAEAVAAVGKSIRAIRGFQSVTIVERPRNLGLSNSIVSGVSELCRQHGRAVVVEDDLVTTPDFLTFVNRALDRYADVPKVFSVTGYNFPIAVPRDYPFDAFASVRSCSWGWGTWADRWKKVEWSASAFDGFISCSEGQSRIREAGADLEHLFSQQAEGKIQGWDVIWTYEHLRHGAVAIRPSVSKVYNIGFDGSGIHCTRAPFQQRSLERASSSQYRFPEAVAPEPYFAGETRRLHRISYPRKIWWACSRHLSPTTNRWLRNEISRLVSARNRW
jgi:hypothetical protein